MLTMEILFNLEVISVAYIKKKKRGRKYEGT